MAFQRRNGFPAGDLGYTRGMDYQYGGSGSGQGTMAQGTAARSQGIGSITGMAGDWEPSVLYLIGLIIGEMIFFHILSRMLK